MVPDPSKVQNVARFTIPWQSLSDEALAGVIEEFVSREGTEYGAEEIPIERKCQQVRDQLARGEAIITYDDEVQTCSISAAAEVNHGRHR